MASLLFEIKGARPYTNGGSGNLSACNPETDTLKTPGDWAHCMASALGKLLRLEMDMMGIPVDGQEKYVRALAHYAQHDFCAPGMEEHWDDTNKVIPSGTPPQS